jgi:hypothetical protein
VEDAHEVSALREYGVESPGAPPSEGYSIGMEELHEVCERLGATLLVFRSDAGV